MKTRFEKGDVIKAIYGIGFRNTLPIETVLAVFEGLITQLRKTEDINGKTKTRVVIRFLEIATEDIQ